MPYGLYIHIPFCRSRCRYCDFYSTGGAEEVPQNYIDALLDALDRHAPRLPNGDVQRPATVYFGGGTPSLLSAAQVGQLLHAANPLPHAEITLEANPESASYGRLAAFRTAGVNRLSLGVQTASDESLARLGRLHTAADTKAALQAASKAGFDNVSGDIMLALPYYTVDEMQQTATLLAEGGVRHISAYLLKIEQQTPFGKNPPPAMPNEDQAADFYLAAANMLEGMGYRQYEISNFAQAGFAGQHNLLYWNCQDYLGLGPGAHSCLKNRRFSFAPDMCEFLAASSLVEEGECTADDFIMLQLRLNKGLDEMELNKRFGKTLTSGQHAELELLQKNSLAEYLHGRWRLTRAGMLVQNSILTRLL